MLSAPKNIRTYICTSQEFKIIDHHVISPPELTMKYVLTVWALADVSVPVEERGVCPLASRLDRARPRFANLTVTKQKHTWVTNILYMMTGRLYTQDTIDTRDTSWVECPLSSVDPSTVPQKHNQLPWRCKTAPWLFLRTHNGCSSAEERSGWRSPAHNGGCWIGGEASRTRQGSEEERSHDRVLPIFLAGLTRQNEVCRGSSRESQSSRT